MIGRKLINGYICEMCISNQHTTIYANNHYINLIINIINENSLITSQFTTAKLIKKTERLPSIFTHHVETPTASNHQSQNKNLSRKHKSLEIVPFDLLITTENINLCLYAQNQDKIKLILWVHLIQPHIHLVVHEKIQKFEISIYDFDMKRSREVMALSSEFLPQKQHFLIPVIETKPGEQNSKTGILSGFFSLKVRNFAHLFTKPAQTINLNSINELTTNTDLSSDVLNSIVCSCSSCFRCYEFMANQANKKGGNTLGKINTDIFIERPCRIKANVFLYEQVNELLGLLNHWNEADDTKVRNDIFFLN